MLKGLKSKVLGATTTIATTLAIPAVSHASVGSFIGPYMQPGEPGFAMGAVVAFSFFTWAISMVLAAIGHGNASALVKVTGFCTCVGITFHTVLKLLNEVYSGLGL